ncbi:MAG: hypothetical protein ACAI44_01660, partial [Candidatus Sericytochromatia bacterium]
EIESLARDGKRLRASGFVKGVGALYTTALEVDETGYLAQGTCNCQWIGKHGLQRGPCKHMLALRFAAEAQTQAESAQELATYATLSD